VIKAIQNAFKIPELRRRIFFTAALIVVYRLGAHITIPGIDDIALENFFNTLKDRPGGNVIGFVDLFAGGAFTQMTIFALGIQPYISASIIMQLLAVVLPSLEKLRKEPDGQKKIIQYTRYGTVILSVVQGIGISWILRNPGQLGIDQPVVTNPNLMFHFLTVITLMAGTSFVMWLGEQITERGIGQGISLIITVGIVAAAPSGISNVFSRLGSSGSNALQIPHLTLFLALIVIAVMGTVYITLATRKIPVQYARRVVGRKVMGGQTTHLPLKVNTAGMIPIIFAVTLMQFPATVLGFAPRWTWVLWLQGTIGNSGHPVYWTIYALLIIGFTYFYTAVQVNPVEMADNLRKYGGFIPGIRPGKRTADYINDTLTRITLPGALFLAAISVIPIIFENQLRIGTMVSGASVLIVVGVVLDTVSQIESYLTMRHYEGFLKERRVRGRRSR
jgi:preprotein translocase subunit SecY